MIEKILSESPERFRKKRLPSEVIEEAKKRVLDTVACAYGAFDEKPVRTLRDTFSHDAAGSISLWGTNLKVAPETAAWLNGSAVRALDFNDTYLSKEPCHPSDLVAPLWAACEMSREPRPGRTLLEAMVLGYDVMCRLCDANSLRVRGWDHVTYLPIASSIACSYIFRLNPEQTRHAIALSIIGNNAMRQTRVGMISDWKASCAAYAARSGLWAARLARAGFTGPSDIFTGKNGFFQQVSGRFSMKAPASGPWMIMQTHTKFYPAEHHAQSAIEAAIAVRQRWDGSPIARIDIETFRVAVEIIGSEKEKWVPTTRETADHSLPYLVVAALLDGNVTLAQFKTKRYAAPQVRALLKRVKVSESKRFTRLYPKKMPNRVTITLTNGRKISEEVLLPKGYAGRPMSMQDVREKFLLLSAERLSTQEQQSVIAVIAKIDRSSALPRLP